MLNTRRLTESVFGADTQDLVSTGPPRSYGGSPEPSPRVYPTVKFTGLYGSVSPGRGLTLRMLPLWLPAAGTVNGMSSSEPPSDWDSSDPLWRAGNGNICLLVIFHRRHSGVYMQIAAFGEVLLSDNQHRRLTLTVTVTLR